MSVLPPFPMEFVSDDLNQQLLNDFTGEKSGFLQVGKEKWILPRKYKNEWANYYNFEVRSDDVWIVTFPRSGTTWTQEMVWLIANNFDYDMAKKVPLVDRFPFLEFNLFVHEKTKEEFLQENSTDIRKQELIEKITQPVYTVLQDKPSPRFIKTHLPFSLLPQNMLDTGCKIIYVARNPKDVAVSFYHLNRLIRTQGYKGNFTKYWDYFQNSLHVWTPYWSHIEEGWKNRNHPNVLFLFYENINKDIKATIREVAQFLNKNISEDQVTTLANYLNIKSFRKNNAVNFNILKEVGMLIEGEQQFIRKGKIGSWREEFTPELNKKANQWIDENLKKIGIEFPCDLLL